VRAVKCCYNALVNGLYVLDPYYNVPIEKLKSILSEKRNMMKQLYSWSPDFVVSSLSFFVRSFICSFVGC